MIALLASPAAAHDNPAAWQPEHRSLADAIGSAAVYGQLGADTFASWRADHRRIAFWRQGCRVGLAFGLSQVMKRSLDSPRPNGVDHHGMPSQHTALAVASAGWQYEFGIPVAMFVGASRVAANWHTPRQVVAGVGIGVLSQWVCR